MGYHLLLALILMPRKKSRFSGFDDRLTRKTGYHKFYSFATKFLFSWNEGRRVGGGERNQKSCPKSGLRREGKGSYFNLGSRSCYVIHLSGIFLVGGRGEV